MHSTIQTDPVSLLRFARLHLGRRDFLKLAAGSALGLAMTGTRPAQCASSHRVALGLDAHAMRWKARQLIDYAAEQRLDAVLFNGLQYFESLDTPYLKRLRDTARSHNMRIYVGAGSISEHDAW
ncbi:MAG: hypothetical protein GY809_08455 [Planctomycetes bacterium]|nr:hypothetical protein [Planctomycetota bacterium]